MEARDVVVVGSGIAGLVAARQLRASGYAPVVLEAGAVPGGRGRTGRLGGTALNSANTGMCSLIDELGLVDEVVEPSAHLNTAVLRNGAWHYLDHSTVRGPLGFSAINLRDRLSLVAAAARTYLEGPEVDPDDVAAHARRDDRSVAEAIGRSAAVFHAGGLTELFCGVEAHQASYALFAKLARALRRRPVELRRGAEALFDRLAEPVDVRCGVTVTRVEETEDGVRVDAHGPDGEQTYLSRSVILATDAHTAGRVWARPPAATRDFLSTVRYSRIDFAYFRTRGPVGQRNPAGEPLAMVTAPATESSDRMLGAIRYVDHRVRTGGLVYTQAAARGGAANLSDAALGDRLEADLLELNPGMAGQITARQVGRHDLFVPVFDPGHVSRLAGFRPTLGAGSIDLAGDYLMAPWMEGALRSGTAAAARTLRRLATIPVVVDEGTALMRQTG